MKPKTAGFIVVEKAEDWEQPLQLCLDSKYPKEGVLAWGGSVFIFPDRKTAREAIERTEHYAKAFGIYGNLPEKYYCVIRECAAYREATK